MGMVAVGVCSAYAATLVSGLAFVKDCAAELTTLSVASPCGAFWWWQHLCEQQQSQDVHREEESTIEEISGNSVAGAEV